MKKTLFAALAFFMLAGCGASQDPQGNDPGISGESKEIGASNRHPSQDDRLVTWTLTDQGSAIVSFAMNEAAMVYQVVDIQDPNFRRSLLYTDLVRSTELPVTRDSNGNIPQIFGVGHGVAMFQTEPSGPVDFTVWSTETGAHPNVFFNATGAVPSIDLPPARFGFDWPIADGKVVVANRVALPDGSFGSILRADLRTGEVERLDVPDPPNFRFPLGPDQSNGDAAWADSATGQIFLLDGHQPPRVIDNNVAGLPHMQGRWLAWVGATNVNAINLKHPNNILSFDPPPNILDTDVSDDGLIAFNTGLSPDTQVVLLDANDGSLIDVPNSEGGFDALVGQFMTTFGAIDDFGVSNAFLYDNRTGTSRDFGAASIGLSVVKGDPVVGYAPFDSTDLFVQTSPQATFDILADSVRELAPPRLRLSLLIDLGLAKLAYVFGQDARAIAHLEEFLDDVADSSLSDSDKAGLSKVAQALITTLGS